MKLHILQQPGPMHEARLPWVSMIKSAVKNFIREGKTHQIPSAIQTGGQFGMQSMNLGFMHHMQRRSTCADQARLVCEAANFFRMAG